MNVTLSYIIFSGREETLDRLANTPDGTFLIRKSDSSSRQYLVSFRHRGNTKSMRVLWVNGRCGLGEATLFDTIPQLVEYFTLHPLPFKCNDSLVKLEYPQLRFESVSYKYKYMYMYRCTLLGEYADIQNVNQQ